ncbi:Lrp/AsnC family transcriptional regulator, partial [Rhizobiaceae sp. 2RAB30]
ALLNGPALGFDVVAFCQIGLHHQSEADLKAFADRTRSWPIVRRAWMVSGDSDFLLHCVATDLVTFQTFVIEELTSAPNVDTVRTALTIRQVKDEGPVAIR